MEDRRRRSMDPAPLKAEAATIKAEVANLVAGLARGDLSDIHDAIRNRKARLEHLEGMLRGVGAAKDFDIAEFTERVGPVLKDWREHLRKNPHTAQQVLRKILPTKISVTPLPDGGWRFDGLCDYRKVLAELGLDAVTAVLEETVTKSSGSPARLAWVSRSHRCSETSMINTRVCPLKRSLTRISHFPALSLRANGRSAAVARPLGARILPE